MLLVTLFCLCIGVNKGCKISVAGWKWRRRRSRFIVLGETKTWCWFWRKVCSSVTVALGLLRSASLRALFLCWFNFLGRPERGRGETLLLLLYNLAMLPIVFRWQWNRSASCSWERDECFKTSNDLPSLWWRKRKFHSEKDKSLKQKNCYNTQHTPTHQTHE